MKDENKTKAQLINEQVGLRQRIAELETSEAERKRAEEALRKAHDELKERTAQLDERVKETE